MRISFPKRDEHHSPKSVSNVNPKFVALVLEKGSSLMYIWVYLNIYIYIYLYENLFAIDGL